MSAQASTAAEGLSRLVGKHPPSRQAMFAGQVTSAQASSEAVGRQAAGPSTAPSGQRLPAASSFTSGKHPPSWQTSPAGHVTLAQASLEAVSPKPVGKHPPS